MNCMLSAIRHGGQVLVDLTRPRIGLHKQGTNGEKM